MSICNILVPFDFSVCSQLAVEHACTLGQQLNAELHIVHVEQSTEDTMRPPHSVDRLMSALPPAYELQNKVRREVLRGNVCDALVKYAKESKSDLIVMGTHGRSGFSHMAHGSVAQRVMKASPCPVVLVKADMQNHTSEMDDAKARYEILKTPELPALDLIARAVSLRASDVHIDPLDEAQYSVRFRIDGRIVSYCIVDKNVAEHLMHQYLTLARLDHADPFNAREGRLLLPATLRDIEARVTSSPVAGGDAMALRLFSKENVFLPLESLGFSEVGLQTVQRMLHGTEGLLLVTGPTGSGKTTTVYSMLNRFGSDSRNIVSIEDPVEFDVPFVRQLNVDERHGVNMSVGLSTLLRMDPDVIFVGEIREPETANIALRAASSGRFVFSSLHTRDVAATVTALRDLGITNHSISGNLIGVVNQRLLRRLCKKCRRPTKANAIANDLFRDCGMTAPDEVYESIGCDACRGTGYSGRTGVFEAVAIDAEISQAVAENATEAELRKIIRSKGVANVTADALTKVQAGILCMDEAISARWI